MKNLKNSKRFCVICGLFMIVCTIFILIFVTITEAKACDLEFDYGIGWIDDNTYYMPAELVEIDQNVAEFRGSNGMIYEWNSAGSVWQISDCFCYLLTMNSNGSHYWWDDEILVVWRA